MPSLRRRRFPLALLLILPALVAGPFATADERPEDGPSPAPSAEPEDGPDRVYAMSGATISWDLDRRRYHPPTAEQAARIAEEMRRWMAAELGGEESPSLKDLPVETMANGALKARLPIYLMNAAMVRVGPGGELGGYCSEGPDLARALFTPVVEEEEK